ncbi:MAG: glycosyltransferase family 4 protein [Armatimonadota bacterium]|nr:glycosyltransferase family 4 protein [Armatimonadota bacterium]
MSLTVAYVDHAAQVGGAERSLVELVTHLDRERFDPLIMHVPDAQWLDEARASGARLVAAVPQSDLYDAKRDELDAGPISSIRRLAGAIRPVGRLFRALGRERPDIVHTNSTKMHLLGGMAARLRGLPVVWHMRDLLTEKGARRWLERGVRRVRPEVIAISEAVAGQFEGLPCRVHVVPNGIPLERFAPGPPPEGLREELGLGAGPVVTVVGRLTPWKGHQVLLRAWPQVAERVPGGRLLIVGEVAFWEDSYQDELHALAQELGVGGSVRWAGFREDVPDLLRLSDLLVLPSIGEPFGRVVIEGMAAALPVVATASGGVPEIVVEGETGLLVPPGEHEPLAEAIVALLEDPARAEAMGQAGHRRALAHFDVRRVAREVAEVYEHVLGGCV